MKELFLAFGIGFLLMFGVAGFQNVFGAELIMPTPPNYRASRVIKVNPSNHGPESCLTSGKNSYPGQTLKVDRSCKSGLRWIYAE